MPFYFLDTSAFTKIYIEEPGSDFMLNLVSRADPGSFAVAPFTKVEFRSALRRRERNGDLTTSDVLQILNVVPLHFDEGRFRIVPLSDSILDTALLLIDRYLLRAYDAIQLACCLSFRKEHPGAESLVFVCADRELLLAAKEESLETMNPEE